ncbi:Endo-1 [Diplonema papillatum]|nr:Endo-1 [Diplonema papillatum]
MMRTLGAPMLWGGLTPRPRFAGGEETHGVLETSFPRAAAGEGKNWGGTCSRSTTRRGGHSVRCAGTCPPLCRNARAFPCLYRLHRRTLCSARSRPAMNAQSRSARWEEKVETFEAAATTEGTAAQRASMAATVAKFAEATDLQQAPAVFKLKAFAAAMVDGGMSEAQLAKFVARESGKRGRPRKGNMRTTSVESYLSALGPKMGVSAAEMKETKRALLKRRLERREMPDHAHPLTLEEARSVMHAAADMEVVAAAALLWGCALRMADLLEIKPEDVTLTARGVLRIAWWTTKEAKLRLREVEVLYQLPPLQREKVKRWIGLKQPFQRATIRHLLALARKLVPGCAEHSWKRGALQHLAKSGAQWDELLLIARHTSIATLRRYLWGCVTPDHTRTARNRATAPQGDEKAAPQSNRATAPQGNEKAAPQSNKTAAPQGNDKAAPQSNRATAPQGNEKAAPQSNKTAAPQGYDKAAPQSNRAAAPQGNEKAAPQSNKTATPQGNDKTAPQSNKAAAPQGNKDAAPQSDKTAVSPGCVQFSSGAMSTSEIRTLFVANIPCDASNREMYLLFSTSKGYEKSMVVRKETPTPAKRLYGFVSYLKAADAEAALEEFNDYVWDNADPVNSKIRVQLSKRNTPDWFVSEDAKEVNAPGSSSTRDGPSRAARPKTLYVSGMPEGVDADIVNTFFNTNFPRSILTGLKYNGNDRVAWVGFNSHDTARDAMGRLDGYVWNNKAGKSTLHAAFANTEFNPAFAESAAPRLGALPTRLVTPPIRTVFVSSLPKSSTKQGVEDFFEAEFPRQIETLSYSTTKLNKPCAFILFNTAEEARRGIEHLSNKQYEGSQLKAEFARTELEVDKLRTETP